MFRVPRSVRSWCRPLAALAGLVAACSAPDQATAPALAAGGQIGGLLAEAPGPLASITVGGTSTQVYPYLADDLSSNGRDPVNLVFAGRADPRSIRAALMALDGARPGPLGAFDCTWKDAVGGLQTAWSERSGWVGSAIQLECGEYGPVRFHLRLFATGGLTLGGAHFEFLIPGTSDHQVVSWELAEQLVTLDLFRTGLVTAPPSYTGPLNAAPWFRTIPGFLYDAVTQDPGFAALVGSLGLQPLGNGDWGLPTDGAATILTLDAETSPLAGVARQDFVIPFGQVVPKPFCVDGAISPYLKVEGDVRLTLTTTQSAGGDFDQVMRAAGRLTLTPWNPLTNQPAGAAYAAEVSESQASRIDRQGARIHGIQHQVEIGGGGPGRGQLQIQLIVGPNGKPVHRRDVRCGAG